MALYCSIAEADEYNERVGNDAWGEIGDTTASKDQALAVATDYLQQLNYKGTITNTSQELNWPRKNVVDKEGREIPDDVIPQQLKDACAELAYIHACVTDITDQVTGSARQLKAGKLTIDYNQSDQAGISIKIKKMLRGLIDRGIQLERR